MNKTNESHPRTVSFRRLYNFIPLLIKDGQIRWMKEHNSLANNTVCKMQLGHLWVHRQIYGVECALPICSGENRAFLSIQKLEPVTHPTVRTKIVLSSHSQCLFKIVYELLRFQRNEFWIGIRRRIWMKKICANVFFLYLRFSLFLQTMYNSYMYQYSDVLISDKNLLSYFYVTSWIHLFLWLWWMKQYGLVAVHCGSIMNLWNFYFLR